MRKTSISKEQYIAAAFRIIREEGLDALSIRRLARDLDCNTANLYRYFSSLEELSMYAGLESLQHYLNDVSVLFNEEADAVKRYYGVWTLFCTHAFEHAALFNLIFFSEHSSNLYKVILEYYAMYPDELSKINGDVKSVFLQGDFDYRDYLMLDEIVKQGKMDEADAVILNNVAVNLFKGYFKTVLDQKMNGEKREVQMNRFLKALRFVMDKYIE